MKKSPVRRILSVLLYLLFLFCIACATVFVYIKWAEYTKHDVIPQLSERKIIKSIFIKKDFIEFAQIAFKNENNGFSASYDFDETTMLSKDMFQTQEMFGEKKYEYHPNIGIYNVLVWSGLQKVEFAVPATSEISKALAKNELFLYVYFKTDSNGFKQTEFPWHPGSYTIFFLGDSFTEGLWVKPEETFVNQVGVKLQKENISVVPMNLGTDGYSALEEDWKLEHYASTFHPKMVVTNLFPNDVHDDYYQVIKGNRIPEKNYDEMFYYIKRMKDFCDKFNIKLVISEIPIQEQFTELRDFHVFEERVKTWCDEHKIINVDVYNYFDKIGADSLYFSWDPHFTPRGHIAYADFLCSQIDTMIVHKGLD
jgi:lysophospholipase L1-like esterase